MEKESVGIVIYKDYMEYLGFLSREDKGAVMEALMEYAFLAKEPDITDKASLLVFTFMKNQLDRDREKYEKKCEINRKNGALGGRPPKDEEGKKREKPEKTTAENKKKAEAEEEDVDVEGAFERFWEEYPKKADETAAKVEFRRAAADRETVDEIMKALKMQKNSEEWTRENGRFIPRASAWLSRRDWERTATPKKEGYSSFDEDDFFAAALADSMEALLGN